MVLTQWNKILNYKIKIHIWVLKNLKPLSSNIDFELCKTTFIYELNSIPRIINHSNSIESCILFPLLTYNTDKFVSSVPFQSEWSRNIKRLEVIHWNAHVIELRAIIVLIASWKLDLKFKILLLSCLPTPDCKQNCKIWCGPGVH